MSSQIQDDSTKPQPEKGIGALGQLFLSCCFVAITGLALQELYDSQWRSPVEPYSAVTPAPLVMKGGDPYIRALMRTISASESNDPRPYSLLYGGEHMSDFSQHPDLCIPIVSGPNWGDCTTAAGRYQFLTTTWLDKAAQYHPESSAPAFWRGSYSFSPEHQDEVVYAWLSDPQAWGVDLAQLLQQGQVIEVLQILSPVWTSLSYGIEPNVMTDQLPQIYEQMLQEELGKPSLF